VIKKIQNMKFTNTIQNHNFDSHVSKNVDLLRDGNKTEKENLRTGCWGEYMDPIGGSDTRLKKTG